MSIIENVKESAPLIKLVFTWASKTMLGRLTLMAIVGIVALGGVTFYNSLQVEKYTEESQLYRAKVEYTDQSNMYQKTLDYINLCINALKANETNRNYYCQKATALYKKIFAELPGSNANEIIKRGAYGAMKVEMQARMRSLKAAQPDPDKPKLDEVSGYLLTTWGIALSSLLGGLLMLTTSITSFRIQRKNSSKIPAANSTPEQISGPLMQPEVQVEQHPSDGPGLDVSSA